MTVTVDVFFELFSQISKVLYFQILPDSRHTLEAAGTKCPNLKGRMKLMLSTFSKAHQTGRPKTESRCPAIVTPKIQVPPGSLLNPH
jgi:hypothetical protein